MTETPRLKLVSCELRHFEAVLTDTGGVEQALGATVLKDSFRFPGIDPIEVMRFMRGHLKADLCTMGWGTYHFVQPADGGLIGPDGYGGWADEGCAVEIGYAVVPGYRNQGLATEAARGHIDHAFAHDHVNENSRGGQGWAS